MQGFDDMPNAKSTACPEQPFNYLKKVGAQIAVESHLHSAPPIPAMLDFKV